MEKRTHTPAALALTLALSLVGLAAASRNLTAQDLGSDIALTEVGRFDQFLDNHPEIAQDLTSNPSLVKDASFVKSHPALEAFLEDHAGIRESLQDNPQGFMNKVTQVDTIEDARSDAFTRRIAALDNFLDNHPSIATQLKANPSLINSQTFMKANPDLVTFMNDHPELAKAFEANPQLALDAVARFDARESGLGAGRMGQVATFDNFLDDHPAIEAQLAAHPSLASTPSFVEAHPELKTFLENHPGIVEDLRNNPQVFMNQVAHFDRHEAKIEQHESLNHK